MKKLGHIAVTAAAVGGASVAHAQFAPPPPGTNPRLRGTSARASARGT